MPSFQLIGPQKLVDHISETLPTLPDDSIRHLVTEMGLTLKDAKTLAALDDGARLDYFDDIIYALNKEGITGQGRTVANWFVPSGFPL